MLDFQNSRYVPVALAVSIVVVGAAVRFYFADANSYWLDELYSVVQYGIANDSVVDAIKNLTRSIHPPLYQFILFHWMSAFGDSEVATRSLSNLYVAGTTLCLYLAARRIYGAWLGVIVALVFTLMFTPTYYGMESCSYAQTIFLSSFSTLLLIYALPRVAEKSWSELVRDPCVWAFLAVNSALLMTHYYNVLFLGAQGLFLIIYLLFKSNQALNALVKSFAVGLTPLAVLLVRTRPCSSASSMRAALLRNGRKTTTQFGRIRRSTTRHRRPLPPTSPQQAITLRFLVAPRANLLLTPPERA